MKLSWSTFLKAAIPYPIRVFGSEKKFVGILNITSLISADISSAVSHVIGCLLGPVNYRIFKFQVSMVCKTEISGLRSQSFLQLDIGH